MATPTSANACEGKYAVNIIPSTLQSLVNNKPQGMWAPVTSNACGDELGQDDNLCITDPGECGRLSLQTQPWETLDLL